MSDKIKQSLSNDLKLSVVVYAADDTTSIDPRKVEIWVEYSVNRSYNNKPFLAKNIPYGTSDNCYISTDNELIVCIPSNTFKRAGELFFRVMLRSQDKNFPDGYQDTWSSLISTNIILTQP